MPTYDYNCPKCGADFSAFVTMSQRDRVPCPHCDHPDVRQKITTLHRSGSARGGGSCATGGCSGCTGCR